MATKTPRIQLVLDFDGTITMTDTTAVIGSHCIAKARELAPPGVSAKQLPKPMESYSEKYMQEHREWKASHKSHRDQRRVLEEEVSVLSQSRHVEQASYLRVRNAVLNTPGSMARMEQDDDMRNAFMTASGRRAVRTGEVQIRDAENLKKLIDKAELGGNQWGIVSVSWSRRFILGVLLEAGLIEERRVEDIVWKIKCNELLAPLAYDQDGEPLVICSAKDKQDAFRGLLEIGEEGEKTNDGGDANIKIYVGDSTTDIGCLAGPTLGMYLTDKGEDDTVIEILKRVKITCLSIEDLPRSNVVQALLDMRTNLLQEMKPPHLVCKIRSFQELYEWVSVVV